MNVAMRYQGIVPLVTAKMEDARFHAMLSFFMKDATSVEVQRMARGVGQHLRCWPTPKAITSGASHSEEGDEDGWRPRI